MKAQLLRINKLMEQQEIVWRSLNPITIVLNYFEGCPVDDDDVIAFDSFDELEECLSEDENDVRTHYIVLYDEDGATTELTLDQAVEMIETQYEGGAK
jgi:hypothetical protein